VTDEEQPSRAVPAIPGHPLDSPLSVREALHAGIGPADGVPGARPIVTAKRLGASVEFRWRAADVPRAGDSFQWRLPSRGASI
jgi:hypothetical protein